MKDLATISSRDRWRGRRELKRKISRRKGVKEKLEERGSQRVIEARTKEGEEDDGKER